MIERFARSAICRVMPVSHRCGYWCSKDGSHAQPDDVWPLASDIMQRRHDIADTAHAGYPGRP